MTNYVFLGPVGHPCLQLMIESADVRLPTLCVHSSCYVCRGV